MTPMWYVINWDMNMQQKHLVKHSLVKGQVQSGWMMYNAMELSNNLDSVYKLAGEIVTAIIVKMLVLSVLVRKHQG